MRMKTGGLTFVLLGLGLGFGAAGLAPSGEETRGTAFQGGSGSAKIESISRRALGIAPARAEDWHQRQKRRKRKEAAIRAAEEKEKERTEDSLVGTTTKELPADCP